MFRMQLSDFGVKGVRRNRVGRQKRKSRWAKNKKKQGRKKKSSEDSAPYGKKAGVVVV